MAQKSDSRHPVWIDIGPLSQPQARWIWWILEGKPGAPREGSRTFSSLRALREHLETQGYDAPKSAQINEAVIQARTEGKDDATLQVFPKHVDEK